MAIFGWLVVALFFTFVTAIWGLNMLNTMRRYTFGGIPNSWSSKVFMVAIGVILCICWWYLVVKAAPFSHPLK